MPPAFPTGVVPRSTRDGPGFSLPSPPTAPPPTAMASDAPVQAAEATEDAPAKAGKRSVLILALAGIVAGTPVGLFGAGPLLAKHRTATPPTAKPAEPSTAVVHPIENLVLNPAGSGGTRFLMVTATFELKDGGAEQMMKDHEAEVRDHILALLGQKTVDELSDITKREEIKQEVLGAVVPLFPKGAVLKVFFPQFVIQ